MNQRETINLLNSIMPDIISSKDPEGTMLKCAEAHNLSPAQLEKLGQTFNTAKTIVGLEKQANRGDSFKLVDVPGLITKYATWTPDKALSKKDQKVHDKIDRLFDDDADGWSVCLSVKSASANQQLPDLNKIVADHFNTMNGGVVDDTDQEEIQMAMSPSGREATWNWKSASVRESKLMSSVEGDLRIAKENIDQLLFEIPMDITEKCAAIARRLTPDEGRWAEVAEDIHDAYGEKAASVINAVETYFANARHHYDKYEDFSKRAFTRSLAQDRHNMFDLVDDIVELQEQFAKVAKAATPAEQAELEKQMDADRQSFEESDGELREEQEMAPDMGESYKKTKAKAPKGEGESGALSKLKGFNVTPGGSKLESGEALVSPKEDINALLDAMSPGTVKDILSAPADAMNLKAVDTFEGLLKRFGPHSDSRAKTIDKAIQQAQMDTTLQQLMLSDDVIADADPKEVQNLFQTLASISPTLATDPGKMGPALKEALQYGSVPINILSDASKLEGQAIKNDLDRANLERAKYSL